MKYIYISIYFKSILRMYGASKEPVIVHRSSSKNKVCGLKGNYIDFFNKNCDATLTLHYFDVMM